MSEVKAVKTGECRSLKCSASSEPNLTYQVVFDQQGDFYLRIIGNKSIRKYGPIKAGTCNKEWVSWEKIKNNFLENSVTTKEIADLCKTDKKNKPPFLMAVLVHLELVVIELQVKKGPKLLSKFKLSDDSKIESILRKIRDSAAVV